MLKKMKEIINASRKYSQREKEIMDSAKHFKETQGWDVLNNFTKMEIGEFVTFSLGLTKEKDYPTFKRELFKIAAEQLEIKIDRGSSNG